MPHIEASLKEKFRVCFQSLLKVSLKMQFMSQSKCGAERDTTGDNTQPIVHLSQLSLEPAKRLKQFPRHLHS